MLIGFSASFLCSFTQPYSISFATKKGLWTERVFDDPLIHKPFLATIDCYVELFSYHKSIIPQKPSTFKSSCQYRKAFSANGGLGKVLGCRVASLWGEGRIRTYRWSTPRHVASPFYLVPFSLAPQNNNSFIHWWGL